MVIRGMPGGAQKSGVGTSPVALNLTPLAKQVVDIWSDDQDLLYCFASTGDSTSLTYAGDLDASDVVLKATRIAAGYKARVEVWARYPYLIVGTVAGTTVVHIKSVSAEGQ